MRTQTSLAALRPNQLLALQLAATFGAIFALLARAWFPGATPNGLRKLLRRLVRARLLVRYGGRNGIDPYWVLSRRGARLLGLPRRRCGPLGWPALIQAVGTTGLAVHADLEKLTAAEFGRDYPQFLTRGVQSGCYALTPEDGLALLVIDHGASGFGITRKVHKAIAQRYRTPAFREAILGGALTVVVGCPTPEKACDIEASLAADPPRFVRVQVVVVPELVPFILQQQPKKG